MSVFKSRGKGNFQTHRYNSNVFFLLDEAQKKNANVDVPEVFNFIQATTLCSIRNVLVPTTDVAGHYIGSYLESSFKTVRCNKALL